MINHKTPVHWTEDLTRIMNTFGGNDRFPVDVKQLAYRHTKQAFPDDPISLVQGASLPGFEGALVKAPVGKVGWGILYNSDNPSRGRTNFTLAHELGHYVLHRQKRYCSAKDLMLYGKTYQKIEREANDFAANLLMPFDDYRRQIDPRAKPTLDDIGQCAKRYKTSLTAATLRWLNYTEVRAVLVVSRDGFIDWAWSSKPAFDSGAFFKTVNRPPVEIPATSLAARINVAKRIEKIAEHDAGVWFTKDGCIEHMLASERYDLTISLLQLEDVPFSGIWKSMQKAPSIRVVSQV